MKRRNPLLSGPYLFWTVAFIIIPLVMIAYYGLTDSTGAFTWSNIAQMGTPERVKALVLSLILTNMKIGATGFIVTIFIIPMWMNSLLRILAWQTLLERNGVINQILTFLHLQKQHMINTPYAIALGMI